MASPLVQSAEFIGSFPDEHTCPVHYLPEYAFIGRSNVGKSSLLNMLVRRKNLALTSGRPGKTAMLNFFLVNKEWYLIDLPGYGYAQRSKSTRRKYAQMIDGYLQKRPNLYSAFVLIDSNVPPQQIDLDFIDKLGSMQVPFAIVFTKFDRRKRGTDEEKMEHIEAFRAKLSETWEELPPQFITSAESELGRRELLKYIKKINQRAEDFR